MKPDAALVCVVGAGLAGLASALAAAQSGLRVQVYATEHGVSDVEAHVDIGPSMLRDLVTLGVADGIVRAGFPYRRTRVMTHDGLELFAIEAKHLAGDRYPAALGIARMDVHRLLAAACAAAGVRIDWNTPVSAVHGQHNGARVQLPSSAIDAGLVVLACGARAGLRTALLQVEAPLGTTGWAYLVTRRPPAIFEPIYAHASAGQKAHAVPIGSRHLGLSINDLSSARAPEDVTALLSRLPGALAELAGLPHSKLTGRQVDFGMAEPRQADAAIVAVGECACTLPPHFGQSAAQAIEDAVVLKAVLQRCGTRAAAPAFEQRRRARRRRVLELTSQAALWDRSPDAQTDLRLLVKALAELHAQPA